MHRCTSFHCNEMHCNEMQIGWVWVQSCNDAIPWAVKAPIVKEMSKRIKVSRLSGVGDKRKSLAATWLSQRGLPAQIAALRAFGKKGV